MIHISVEFLLRQRNNGIFLVSRVPSIGEFVSLENDDESYEVIAVFHMLNPKDNCQAIVRVK